MPVRRFLVFLRGGETEKLVPGRTHERDAQREARRVEAARNGRGRQAAEIAGGAERIRWERVPRLEVRFDGARVLLSTGYEAAEVTSSCICGLEVRGRHIRNGRNPGGRH